MGLASLLVALLGTACSGGTDAEPLRPGVQVATPTLMQSATGVSGTVAASATSTPSQVTATLTTVPVITAISTIPAANQSPAATPVPAATTAPKASAVSLTVRATNLAFDTKAIRVPSGATVSATMQNDDIGQDHNLTFGLPGLPHGNTCRGPCTATQVFKVDAPGEYSFLCTIHDMFGTFTVDP